MFDVGPGEVVVLASLAVVFFGPLTMKELFARLARGLRLHGGQPWRRAEWVLVTGALILASFVVAVAAAGR